MGFLPFQYFKKMKCIKGCTVDSETDYIILRRVVLDTPRSSYFYRSDDNVYE